jgi:hypothetical protein
MFLFEDLVDEAHPDVALDLTVAVGNGNAGALLATVLEGIERKKGEACNVLTRRVDPKDGARFLQLIHFQPPPDTNRV